jgi:anti-sigma regulatory factor (Ser/Thr protein kinase)
MEGQFRRSFESLDEIFALTEQFFAREAIDRRHCNAINLAVEELFTNMVKYNPGGEGEIGLQLQLARDAVQVRLSDREASPFDVTMTPAVDPDAPLQERQSGGLGLYLVHKFVDSLDYAYLDGQTTITFTRKLD